MACKERIPSNELNFLRFQRVTNGVIADLPITDLCPIELAIEAPSNLVATAFTGTIINLSWDDNSSNESMFEIGRSLVGGGVGFALIATVGANVTTYQDTGLDNGTEYFYRVRATSILNSDYSNESRATTFVPFKMQWKTDNTGESNNDQIELPIVAGGTYDFRVDWSDGNIDEITAHTDAARLHTYTASATYDVEISGQIKEWDFNAPFGQDDKEKLILISQWSTLQILSVNSVFSGCVNMEITATDALDLTFTTSLNDWFNNCDAMTGAAADFSGWDTSGILDMQSMFRNCNIFNGSGIGSWDTSSVTSMASMFVGSATFNQNLNSWDVSNVTGFNGMFSFCDAFDQPLNNWVTTSGTSFQSMFQSALVFNQAISNFDVSGATSMSLVFDRAAAFNQDITGWDVSGVTNFVRTFEGASSFNQAIGGGGAWDVGAGTNFTQMFKLTTVFNQPLDNWDMSSALTLTAMFTQAPVFNQSLNSWDVAGVTNMQSMFASAFDFNGNITGWTTTALTVMSGMFSQANAFNQDISGWDVDSVADFSNLFFGADVFNQSLNSWTTTAATDMGNMFNGASAFDQNCAGFDVTGVTVMENMFLNSSLGTTNYDLILVGYNGQAVQNNIDIHFGTAQYSAGAPTTARSALIADHFWVIIDGGQV